MTYNETVLEHFQNPRNVGVMEDADIVGEAGSVECGDTTAIYLKLDGNVIKDITFKTYGCAAAIASSSVMTEMVKGMTIDEALKLTKDDIVKELGGLPDQKLHCSLLAEDALKVALHNALEAADKKTK